MDEQQTIRLVTEAQAGSREAFGQLVKHFETAVFATVMSRLRHRAEAPRSDAGRVRPGDAEAAATREPARFGGWLRQIAVRIRSTGRCAARTRRRSIRRRSTRLKSGAADAAR